MIIRTEHSKDNPYFLLNRAAANDARLSFKAVGLHTYLMSKPDHWQTREADLINRHKEGATAVRSAMAELRKYGYIETKAIRDEATNRFTGSITVVHEVPDSFVSRDAQNLQTRETEDIVSNESLVSNEGEGTHAKNDNVVKERKPTKRQLDAAEHVNAAREYGLTASEFRTLVDAYLAACGQKALADTNTDMGARELSKAKDAALAGLGVGILEPIDVEKRAAAARAQWPDGQLYYTNIIKQTVSASKSATAPITAVGVGDGEF